MYFLCLTSRVCVVYNFEEMKRLSYYYDGCRKTVFKDFTRRSCRNVTISGLSPMMPFLSINYARREHSGNL